MAKMSLQEYLNKIEIAESKMEDAREALRQAEKDFLYSIDLIQIDYYGPN
jgi:hypothetical protein